MGKISYLWKYLRHEDEDKQHASDPAVTLSSRTNMLSSNTFLIFTFTFLEVIPMHIYLALFRYFNAMAPLPLPWLH